MKTILSKNRQEVKEKILNFVTTMFLQLKDNCKINLKQQWNEYKNILSSKLFLFNYKVTSTNSKTQFRYIGQLNEKKENPEEMRNYP